MKNLILPTLTKSLGKIILLISTLSLLVNLSNAQPNWIHYTPNNSGLPFGSLRSLTFDSAGYLAIGGLGGLIKYDGNYWTTFTEANSDLPNNQVNEVRIDSLGNYWLATEAGGIATFNGIDNFGWTIYDENNTILSPSTWIESIEIDPNGNKWITQGSGGVVMFDGVNWTPHLPQTNCRPIDFDQNGNVWVGSTTGLRKYDGNNWTVYNTGNSPLPENGIHCLEVDTGNRIWIGTSGSGVVLFDGVNWTIYDTTNSNLMHPQIWEIYQDSYGTIWMGSDGGYLNRFDGNNWTVYQVDTIYTAHIYEIEEDPAEDSICLWLDGGGLIHFCMDGTMLPVESESRPGNVKLKVYPNPTEGKFEVRSSELGVEKIEIYDLFGRLVLRSNEPQIDMSSYPAGLYIWQVGTARGKIVLE